jgi:predicted O-methyltransferase YrrM
MPLSTNLWRENQMSQSINLEKNGRDLSAPDLKGSVYLSILKLLHSVLKPKSYLEIGTQKGQSLSLASCASISIDPYMTVDLKDSIGAKPSCFFFQMTSDDFYEKHDPASILGRPLDFAFLDGMHRCEYLLRDFANTEKFCRPNSIIALHDCFPVEVAITGRSAGGKTIEDHRAQWWTGDVWRTALLLKRRRPDLTILSLSAPPTGLAIITNLSPASKVIHTNYGAMVEEMLAMDLSQIGIKAFFDEMELSPTSVIDSHEKITAKFWL